MIRFHPLAGSSLVLLLTVALPLAISCAGGAAAPPDEFRGSNECAEPEDAWLWCDDFEENRLGAYFEYDDADGSFVRAEGVGVGGSTGMRATFREGQVSAGSLRLAVGATPQSYFSPVDEGTIAHRELHWRFYLRHAPDWRGGGGDKLTRATVFSDRSSWAQAMIAHVWSGSPPHERVLVLDPASGIGVRSGGARASEALARSHVVRTTRYNDFDNLDWLGIVRGGTPIFADGRVGRWYCIEVGVRLNRPGRADGTFELRIDGNLEAKADGLDWVGSYEEFGINAVFLENYWNAGSPARQERYFDRFIVSTERVGCADPATFE